MPKKQDRRNPQDSSEKQPNYKQYLYNLLHKNILYTPWEHKWTKAQESLCTNTPKIHQSSE